ncbi:hypothetical protein Tco_1390355 [Tanacetum coccineum]
MHTSRDDYLINTLRFVSAKEATQIYGDVLPESLTSPEMKETKAYKTYLGFAIGATPPKKARKFKKLAFPQLTTVPVSPEEPTGKSKRVKRPTKKSTKAAIRGVVIRETLEMPLSKKKKNMTLKKRKGIDLLSEGNDEDDNNNEHDSSGEDNSEHETDENESGSESHQDENEEDIGDDDEEEVKDESVKTPSNNSDDKDETNITDKAEGDKDKEMDYTTSQL